ncbi:energy transducer TonB [Massilia sp. 9I]|uniref:energy transducer TonB n=1 Tax=Massilia sp. 9I TaxID=2653152 RepID=UPI00135901D5
MHKMFHFHFAGPASLHRSLHSFLIFGAIIVPACAAQTNTSASNDLLPETASTLPKLRSAMPVMPCERPAWSHAALRKQMTGTVTMKFLIDTDGTVLEKEIFKSSGYPIQDKAALEATARCKLQVAPQDSQPKKEWVLLQYVWTLE